MNILEFYLKKNKFLKILIIGINIDKINDISSTLSKDLSLPLIKINNLTEKEYFNIEKIKINKEFNINSSFIMSGFGYPDINMKFDLIYNIKFDSKIFIDKNLENSKEIYNSYKNYLQKLKVDKFIKFEETEKTIDIIFNHLMDMISNNIYKKNTIFNENKKPFVKGKINKKNWDKDNLYVDIDDYNDEMHNTKIYEGDKIDNDIFKEMEDSSYSPDEKIYFVKDFFYKNFTGGSKSKETNYSIGRRYLIN